MSVQSPKRTFCSKSNNAHFYFENTRLNNRCAISHSAISGNVSRTPKWNIVRSVSGNVSRRQCEHTAKAVSCPNAACLTQLKIGAEDEDEDKNEGGDDEDRNEDRDEVESKSFLSKCCPCLKRGADCEEDLV